MTRAEFAKYRHAAHIVPDLEPNARCIGLISYFNNIRSFAGVVDNPLTMDIIEGWQRHTYVTLNRWERDCMFAMDRAFRHAYGNVLKYHADRPQVGVKGKDKDWSKANG